MDTYEFGSTAYFEKVLELWEEIFRQNPEPASQLTFSESYEYHGAPEHLSPDGSPIGFHFRWDRGEFAGALVPDDTCDIEFHVRFDVAKLVWSELMEEPAHEFIDPTVKDRLDAAKADGSFVRVDKAPIPTWFYPVHNRIAEITA